MSVQVVVSIKLIHAVDVAVGLLLDPKSARLRMEDSNTAIMGFWNFDYHWEQSDAAM